ncbi:MAG: penicillin-binding protein activator [Proteobacteria bacterium]|nr:penicillin-binding protein activator [Pseudomonadota bacterium]
MVNLFLKYNFILPICIFFTIISCNQTNTKVVTLNKGQIETFIEDKNSSKNYLKKEVLKQKIKLNPKPNILPHEGDSVIFEFRKERVLQGRDPEHLLQKQKKEEAILAVTKMFQQNLSNINKNIIVTKKNEVLIDNSYQIYDQNNLVNKNILVFLPLTGLYSNFGNDIREAIDLSMLQTSRENIKLIYYDTGKKFDLKILDNLLNHVKPKIIIGPFTRESLLKVKELVKEKSIPIITFSNDIAILENNIWSLGVSPEEQIESVISCALKNKFKRFGLVVPDNLYGKIILENSSLLINFDKNNFFEHLSLSNNQLNNKNLLISQLRSFLNYQKEEVLHTKFDAIILAGSKEFILEIAPLLAYLNVDSKSVKILGTHIFNDKDIRNEPSLEKSWFPIINSKDDIKFKSTFKNVWKKNSNYFSTVGFDSGLLAFDFLNSGIESIKYFENVESPIIGFKFKKNGQVEKPIHVKQIDNLGKLSSIQKCQNSKNQLNN